MYLPYGTLSYLLEDMQTIEKIWRTINRLSNNFPTMKDLQPEFTKFTVSPT